MKNKVLEYGEQLAHLYSNFSVEKPIDLNPMATSTVTFQVTDACNLACTYCYQINKGNHRMSFETA
jgi:sulfatase maturation enzyme AslB (radical SAM superfamily)